MISRIVRQLELSRGFTPNTNTDSAWEFHRIRHRIRVWIQARIMSAFAAHEVAFLFFGSFLIFAEELFGGGFKNQRSAIELVWLQP